MNRVSRVIAIVLSVVMLISSLPMMTLALVDGNIQSGAVIGTNGYYNIISRKDYVLVPGAATETELVINNAEGTRRQVLHVIEVDPSNPDVSIVPGYYGIDKDLTNVENQTASNLTDTAAYYEDTLGYNIVGGMNTDLTYSSNAPRVLVYNGKDLRIGANTSSMLCVYKEEDGTVSCEVSAFNNTTIDEGLASGRLLHALPVSFGMVVKDGELVSKTEERTSAAAARSMVGVKEDGTLVICMNDGRGANNSVGLCNYEEGEIMLALGCKWAANCDGGGSSTFLTKRVGEEEFTMRSVPCDGAQRATLHGIFVASNVAPTGVLDVVNVDSAYDYFAPNTTYTFSAEAIDTHGYAMDMPADVSWALSDTSFGTIENGTFVSNGKLGAVDVQVSSGGKVVGVKTITVAHPATFELSATSTVMPYSTADRVRSITLPIVAMIGEANVYYDTNAVSVVLSDKNAGTVDGYTFTATTDMEIAGVNVTMTYLPTNAQLVYTIEFGKGSEVIFDFEDGDVSDWMGFDEAKQWSIDNGVNNTLVGANPLAGQFSDQVDGSTFLATTTNGGQVHSGNNALAWTVDNQYAEFAGWTYNVLFNIGETVVLRDVENGKKATALGMWLYIPEGATGLAFQSQLYTKNADGTYSCKQDHFMFTTVSGEIKNLNSCTEADIPESRWVYASIDISKYDYLCTPVATDEGNSRSPSFIRTYIKPTLPAAHTFYIDDITLDYSSAVDDRILPTIADVSYVPNDTLIALSEGAAITDTTIAFSAAVADNEALDASSAKVYIDGVAVKAEVAAGMLSSESVTLNPGAHTVAIEISDELGNVAKVTRNFTISGDAVVALGGHNDSNAAPEYDSIYYVDIDVADIACVNELSATLKLQNANKWEIKGATAAQGFDMSCEYNEISGLLTVTLEANGETIDTEMSTIVSVPVRVWSWNAYNHVTGAAITPEAHYATGYCPVVTINCEIVKGEVTLSDDSAATFGGSILVDTKLNDTVNPWHVHDEELTALNQGATCTQAGYTDRTYCETCASVIDWGKTVEATGHTYELVDGAFVCHCGAEYAISTGLINMNGINYYAIGGKPVSGWQMIEDTYYYFDKTTFAGLNGNYSSYEVASTSQSFTYSFTNGKLDSGAWVKMEDGTRYYYGPTYYHNTTTEIDGKTYSFRNNGYRYEGTCVIKYNPKGDYQLYEFTEDGVFVGTLYVNGVYTISDGSVYYFNNGIPTIPGLVQDDEGNYYYFHNSYIAVKDGSFTVTNTNGLLDVGVYDFDATGKMIIKNGIVRDKDGYVRYYVNNVPTYAGLVKDTDGSYYYISGSTYTAVTNCSRYITFTNDLLPVGTYKFGEDGKLIIKQGIVKDADGYIRYYIDGVAQYAGLVKDTDGSYYYISGSTYTAVTNCSRYITFTNDLLPIGTYKFDEDGKMILKNGIIKDADGYIRYYVNDQPTYAGLVKDTDGNYYYISGSGCVAITNCSRYITFTNGLLPVGTYKFDAEGKMIIKQGIVKDADGYIRYYIDGVAQYAGLVQDKEGNYYYISGNGGMAVTNCTRYISNTNDLLPAGMYTFGEDGKMIIS